MTAQSSQFIGRRELVALMAMLLATTAFSIDAMLPAIPEIAAEITPDLPNHASWVLTSFVAGLGIGTFLTGPLADAYGRKRIIYLGASIYMIAALAAWVTTDLTWLLLARFFQGIGGAGARIVPAAIIRDLFSGRDMARILSFVMMIFILVPAISPLLGAWIMGVTGWRGIFPAFVIFAALATLWFALRIVEPLVVEKRRPLSIALMADAVRDIFGNRAVRLSIIAQTLIFSMLFSTLTMIQPVYDQVFERNESFPYWFGLIAVLSGSASLLNATIVVRIGMRQVAFLALISMGCISFVLLVLTVLFPVQGFWFFLIWQFCAFSTAGLTIGNLNAIAMEPMGHIAGMAASVTGGVATVIAAVLASPIGTLFNGTPYPLLGATIGLAFSAAFVLWVMKRVLD